MPPGTISGMVTAARSGTRIGQIRVKPTIGRRGTAVETRWRPIAGCRAHHSAAVPHRSVRRNHKDTGTAEAWETPRVTTVPISRTGNPARVWIVALIAALLHMAPFWHAQV